MIRSTGNAEFDAIIEFEVSYNQTRWAEVWLAVNMVVVGLTLLHTPGDTFALSAGYKIIASYVSEPVAGWISLGCGILRILALHRNGRSPRKSPMIRVIGCSLGGMFWASIFLGFSLAIARGEMSAWPLLWGWSFTFLAAEIHSSARASRDAVAYARYKRVEAKHAGRVFGYATGLGSTV